MRPTEQCFARIRVRALRSVRPITLGTTHRTTGGAVAAAVEAEGVAVEVEGVAVEVAVVEAEVVAEAARLLS